MYKGFIKATLVAPKVEIGNVKFNIDEILKSINGLTSDIVLLPELSTTSYSCMDLFLTDELIKENYEGIKRLISENTVKGLLVVGGIYKLNSQLFNSAFVIKDHKLLGIVPKYYLPNYKEYSESRWFNSGFSAKRIKEVEFNNELVPFGNIIFKCKNSIFDFGIGIEICEDVWVPISPSNIQSLNGANIFLNLSASNECLDKDNRRRNMVLENSRKNRGAYLYCSANSSETSTGLVYSASMISAVNGTLLKENQNLTFDTKKLDSVIDLEYLDSIRMKDNGFRESLDEFNKEFKIVEFDLIETKEELGLNPYPFRIVNESIIDRVFELESFAIYKRLNHIKQEKMILGVSGGLDSTIALIILYEAALRMNKNPKDVIIPVFLPTSNSSLRTKNNASELAELLGLDPIVIPISEQVELLLNSIDHKEKDITYENAQVRIRTSILMELSNKYNGIMIGTSDLSEIAMGYSTYNGDSMSMYNINSSFTKTFIQSFISLYANNKEDNLKRVLLDIVDTPISAELNINQFTENEIGKYIYIDFILYRFLKLGNSKDRIIYALMDTFKLSDIEAKEIVDRFFKRFYSQQYKRNASPDSIKITDLSLDPHLDYRMASDVKR